MRPLALLLPLLCLLALPRPLLAQEESDDKSVARLRERIRALEAELDRLKARIRKLESDRTALRIGICLPKSGPLARLAEEARRGFALGSASGVAFRSLPYASDEEAGKRALKAFSEGADLICGGIGAADSVRLLRAARKGKRPILLLGSTHPDILPKEGPAFRTGLPDPVQGRVLAEYVIESEETRQLAILSRHGSDYARWVSGAFRTRLLELGGEILFDEPFAEGAPVGPLVDGVLASGAEAVCLIGFSSDIVPLLAVENPEWRALTKLGPDAWYGPRLRTLPDECLAPCRLTALYHPSDPRSAEFVQAYRAAHDETPGPLAALGWEAARLLEAAAGEDRTPKGIAWRLGKAETRGVAGKLKMGNERHPERTLLILKPGKTLDKDEILERRRSNQ